MTPTLQQILCEMGTDPVAWENANVKDQIMVVLCWGGWRGRNFGLGELCGLLGLPGDVVSTVLDGLEGEGFVFEVRT